MKRKKTKMGRPPKKAKDKLSEIVTLRMTPAEHKQLMRDAKRSGLSVSAYLQTCWQKVKREGDSNEKTEAHTQKKEATISSE